MKIAIIGYSGAGKSTLAKKLGKKYQCPVLYLDTVNFLPGWEVRENTESKKIVKAFLENPSWVIDGNYKEMCRKERLEAADRIIFLDFPRRTCLIQAYRRYRKGKKKVRESMAKGCEEKFDFEFFKWILFEGRTKERRQDFANVCRRYKEKVIVCKNRKEVEELLWQR